MELTTICSVNLLTVSKIMIVLEGVKRKEGIGCHNRCFFDKKRKEVVNLCIVRYRRYGYENIPLNARGIYVALRQMQEKSFVVVTLDETAGDRVGTEQFYHISGQIREYLMGRGCAHCVFLYLLISDDDSSAGGIYGSSEAVGRTAGAAGVL